MRRKQYSSSLKAKIVIDALRETKTVAQLAPEHQIHPNLITKWKPAVLAGMPEFFDRGVRQSQKEHDQEQKVAELYQEIGRFTTQVSWLKKLASTLTLAERRTLNERESSSSSLSWQTDLLSIARTGFYYHPAPPSDREVQVKHQMDVYYTDAPFLGSRKLAIYLTRAGLPVSRHTIRRYRQEMGFETLDPKPHLSSSGGPEHKVYPYLLRGLAIERCNQVWGVDITYIRLQSGWVYLVVFLDWF